MPTNTVIFKVDFVDATVGSQGLVMSVTEFKELFLWGLPLYAPSTGQTLPEAMVKQKLLAAQSFVERLLDLRLLKQYLTETHDFIEEEYRSWAFLQLQYNINRVLGLTGTLNEKKVLNYPPQWMTVNTSQVDQFRNLNLVPNGQNSTVTLDFIATVNNQWFSIFGNRRIANFFLVEYISGFNQVPEEIINLIGKVAAVQLLPIIDLVITGGGSGVGYTFGAASTSLSMDGLSQSIGKANGGNVFQQRLAQYKTEIAIETQQLKDIYSGFKFTVM